MNHSAITTRPPIGVRDGSTPLRTARRSAKSHPVSAAAEHRMKAEGVAQPFWLHVHDVQIERRLGLVFVVAPGIPDSAQIALRCGKCVDLLVVLERLGALPELYAIADQFFSVALNG